jgi:tetratricopeptide (TPR) repeat protein
MTSASRFFFASALGIALIAAQRNHTLQAAEVEPAVGSWLTDLRTELRAECQQVELALAGEGDKSSRAELLAMYGRSAWASGEFGQSAAAYAMFLSEFGLDHAYSERIIVHLGASLSPLDLSSVDVSHTNEGPKYQPTWRAGKAASKERLRFAAATYELLASTTNNAGEAGKAFLSLGWVYRALNDWTASTAAWDRAADAAKGSPAGAEARWHAADNLAWTNQPAAAAQRLRRLVADYPNDARIRSANDRIESLDAESRRTAQWLNDPVTSVQKEIVDRAAQRKPQEVYASVIQWLRAQRNSSAIVAVSRWAIGQADWPLESRLNAYLELADALLQQAKGSSADKREAADAFGQVVSLASKDNWAIPAAIRRSRLLSELRDFDAADKTLDESASRWKGNGQWEPRVLMERMESLIDRGNLSDASVIRDGLHRRYPDYEIPTGLASKLAPTGNGGGR